MGELLIVLTAVSWAGIAWCYGRAAARQLTMVPFVAIVATVACVCSGAAVLRWNVQASWAAQAKLAGMMAACGVFSQLGMVLNGVAMRTAPERCSVAWTLFQMAMVMPFFWAWRVWGQPVAWYQWAALAPLVVALVALAPAGRPCGQSVPADARRSLQWGRTLFVAWIMAGLSQVLAQESSLRDWPDVWHLRAPLSLGAAAVFLWGLSAARGARPTAEHWRLGLLTGLVVAAGNVLLFMSLDALSAARRTFIAYPVAVGGSIALFSVYQLASRREPFGWRKALGLACGVVALTLMALRGR